MAMIAAMVNICVVRDSMDIRTWHVFRFNNMEFV